MIYFKILILKETNFRISNYSILRAMFTIQIEIQKINPCIIITIINHPQHLDKAIKKIFIKIFQIKNLTVIEMNLVLKINKKQINQIINQNKKIMIT